MDSKLLTKKRELPAAKPWFKAGLPKENETLKRVWENKNCSFEVFLCAIGALGSVRSFDLEGNRTIFILFLSGELFLK